jgi:hypothetical protein
MEARVTAHSQAYRLRERMEQAKVQHGQEIRADVPGIRVLAMTREWFTARHRGKGEVFFCTMGPIRVREVTVPGDGSPLPSDVVIDGLEVASGGSYDLLNVLVQSNGGPAADRGRRDAGGTRDQRTRDESGSDLTFV